MGLQGEVVVGLPTNRTWIHTHERSRIVATPPTATDKHPQIMPISTLNTSSLPLHLVVPCPQRTRPCTCEPVALSLAHLSVFDPPPQVFDPLLSWAREELKWHMVASDAICGPTQEASTVAAVKQWLEGKNGGKLF